MISVIIPAYNAVRTIGETIDSITAQSHQPDEIIVVDDGSTDGTGEHPALALPNLRVVRQANGGGAAALNTGIRNAQGNLLAFLDADDLWASDKLARQSGFLAANPDVPAVSGHFKTFACPTSTEAERARWQISSEPQPGWLFGTTLFRQDAVQDTGLLIETLHMGFNIEWFARLRGLGLTPAMLPDVVMHRRIHAGSMSQRSPERDRGYLATARVALARKRQQQKEKQK